MLPRCSAAMASGPYGAQVMLEIADALQRAHIGPPLFHVYSEGSRGDFPLLSSLAAQAASKKRPAATRRLQQRPSHLHRALLGNVPPLQLVWHLNEDMRTTMAGMVRSDILVMGHSSLSYIAALYRGGDGQAAGSASRTEACRQHALGGPGGRDGGVGVTGHAEKSDAGKGSSGPGRSGAKASTSAHWSAGVTLYHDHFQVAMHDWLRYSGPGSFSRALQQSHVVCRLQRALHVRQ